jgi:hypothetical protein
MKAIVVEDLVVDMVATTTQVTSLHCARCAKRKGTQQIGADTSLMKTMSQKREWWLLLHALDMTTIGTQTL